MLYLRHFLAFSLFIVVCFARAQAQQPETTEKKVENPIGAAEEQRKSLRQTPPTKLTIIAQPGAGAERKVEITS